MTAITLYPKDGSGTRRYTPGTKVCLCCSAFDPDVDLCDEMSETLNLARRKSMPRCPAGIAIWLFWPRLQPAEALGLADEIAEKSLATDGLIDMARYIKGLTDEVSKLPEIVEPVKVRVRKRRLPRWERKQEAA